MRTVLIAHRDPAVAVSLEADLRRAGYQIKSGPRIGSGPSRHPRARHGIHGGRAEAAPGVMARAENVFIAAQDRAEMLLQIDQLDRR